MQSKVKILNCIGFKMLYFGIIQTF